MDAVRLAQMVASYHILDKPIRVVAGVYGFLVVLNERLFFERFVIRDKHGNIRVDGSIVRLGEKQLSTSVAWEENYDQIGLKFLTLEK